ncbi:4Fe-4S binding protein [Clostridium transplantifaecale]|uniref:4Fe-4S binding protein n=1 Tax=Clostridium transplantifaecale TaxID=2479838 RepID=UPI000F63E4C6|nr:4Fe-4S binding protein [Clostridium transplantifaecale]
MSVKTTAKRCVSVNEKSCVACGACQKVCPKTAIEVFRGCYAAVDPGRCVGCGLCARICPAGALSIFTREVQS